MSEIVRYKFIYQVIYARIAGTGIHLVEGKKDERIGRITYKEYKVWGIKTFIKEIVEFIYCFLTENLPKDKELFNSDELMKPLMSLCELFNCSIAEFETNIESLKIFPEIWDTMDFEQQAAFYINAFFEVLDEVGVDNYKIALIMSQLFGFLYRNKTIQINQHYLQNFDFLKKDFGFVYRAREYVKAFSYCVYNGSFNNLIKRINKALYQEYLDTFIFNVVVEKSKIRESEKNEEITDEFYLKVLEMLRNGTDDEKLFAIEEIIQNKFINAIDELEYYLKYNHPKVMNAALDGILYLRSFKGDIENLKEVED